MSASSRRQGRVSARDGFRQNVQAALCLLMAVLLATCMVPFVSPAVADDSSDSSFAAGNAHGLRTASTESEFNVRFPSATNSTSDLQVVLSYSDNLFATKADTYNDKLGYASACLAVAAGNSSAEASYADKGKNIEAFLGMDGVGCSDVTLNAGYTSLPLTQSNIGVAIGHKDITVSENNSSKTYKLFVVGVRGISYEAEWASNLLVGNSGDHQGLAEARDSVLGFILPYIRDHTQSGDNVKIWISGYSRGGAVANLVGGWLDSWLKDSTTISGMTPEVQYAHTYDANLMRNTVAASYNLSGRKLSAGDIYCYTVSTPQGAAAASVEANNRYCVGVHNLINPDDWIPQLGMSWWRLGRYGTDHDISSTDRSDTINRDTPMLPDKAAAVTAMLDRLKKISPSAAYTSAWFKEYYFSLWDAGVVEDKTGAGNKFISQGKELVGQQGRYFEEFGRFLTGALAIDERGAYVTEYQEDLSYLAKLLMGLSPSQMAKLPNSLKAHLTQELRVALNMPNLSLDNMGAETLVILNLVMNKESDFANVCAKALKGTLDELGVTYNESSVEKAMKTLAKAAALLAKADMAYFYHLLTMAKAVDGIAQAHYPEQILAWWEGSDRDPVEPQQLNKVELRFYDNIDDDFSSADDVQLFTRDMYEGDRLFISDAEPPTIDGKVVDDGVFYYTTPKREGYTFVGWQTYSEAEQATHFEFYNSEDSIYYGDFDAVDIEGGTCDLYAVWSFDGDFIAECVANMTTDEKISQLIVPAIRTWDGANVTDLSAAPALAEALQAHNYGGIILYGANVSGVEQTVRLTTDLQVNNGNASWIPYLMCVDGEGGLVTRLTMGTRMTGSMAIGATGAAAEVNANKTGQVIGDEVSAAGFNVDFAPDIDVNSNPANPVIGTRAFSDDAQKVAALGVAFAEGLSESSVIGSYKHFPGHGDTATDSHIGTPAVNKTYEELMTTEFVPFQSAVAAGADLIMTAHVTLPLADDEITFADGTKGYYPATMSPKVITEYLREDLGYDGVVVTDALEMAALYETPLVKGGGNSAAERKASAEYGANLAIKVIESGTDILLVPTDLNSATAAQYYDDYIKALVAYADTHPDFKKRVEESATRILRLKDEYGILDMDVSGGDVEQKVAEAEEAIGSTEHHATESDIAKQAVTLLKNDNYALPLSGHEGNIVIFARDSDHVSTIDYAISKMQDTGLIDADAYVVNLEDATSRGSASSKMKISVGFYRDYPEGGDPVVHYTDTMKQAVAQADTVVTFSVNSNLTALQPTADQYQGVSQIMADAHAAGAPFVLLSCNLPYDAARYQDADAIMCCYMAAGLDSDPTDSSGELVAYNANVVCALESMFDAFAPGGTLPVNAPTMVEAEDGTVSYSDVVLYERGSGLQAFDYAFVEGAGGVHEHGATSGLHFKANARHDKLVGLYSDGVALDGANYTVSAGSTEIDLGADYLNSLEGGEHSLEAVYDYGSETFSVSTTYSVMKRSANPTASNTSSAATSGSPKTGDALPMDVVIALVVVAVLAAIALALAHAKRKKNRV